MFFCKGRSSVIHKTTAEKFYHISCKSRPEKCIFAPKSRPEKCMAIGKSRPEKCQYAHL